MAEKIPVPQALMLPWLQAAVKLGGKGRYQDINELALDFAEISAEQRAVEFPDDATSKGPKIDHRLAWARSMLKRIGAAESPEAGSWQVTDYGREIAAMAVAEAESVIDSAVREKYAMVEPTSDKLAEFRRLSDAGMPESMTVREMLRHWGVSMRSSGSVARIRDTLEAANLATDPDFTLGSLDTTILLVSATPASSSEGTDPTSLLDGFDYQDMLLVSNVPAATAGVESVHSGTPLLEAQSMMHAGDFSQLPVMEGTRKVVGAVTWKSIAQGRKRSQSPELDDCIAPAPRVVERDYPLLRIVPEIYSEGFVLVRGAKSKIVGIVTAADLSQEFAKLTQPFLLVGQIERLVRRAIDRIMSAEEIQDSIDPDIVQSEIDGAHSLTFGAMQIILQSPVWYDRLGWHFDRKTFNSLFERVRLIRNAVTHFSPDPVDSVQGNLLIDFLDLVVDLETHRSIDDGGAVQAD